MKMRLDETAAAMGGQPNAAAKGKAGMKMDQDPTWKQSFRQTLDEIRDQGFGNYAKKINDEKLEHLRKKILASMGLSEDDLAHMDPAKRTLIEKMVNLEMQHRLAAEGALQKDRDVANGGEKAPGDIANQLNAAPNGLGAGLVLLAAIEGQQQQLDEPKKG
ncbi:MAG: hypothetical protein O2944_08180 [Proteobacteria bacterium]|nr:hypothetical protein [Pseudomonadota bacterium]